MEEEEINMKKVIVDESKCIRCGACTGICPDVFTFTEDDTVESIEDKNILDHMTEETKKEAMEALHGCPVDAIKEVDAD